MGEFQKTDTLKSPLLKPVIQRDYTKSDYNFNPPSQQNDNAPDAVKDVQGTAEKPKPDVTPGPQTGSGPAPGAAYDDKTKAFTFDEETGTASDLGEGEPAPELKLSSASARGFANTIGNMIQIYVPKFTYEYVKIDIANARINVEKGLLTGHFVDTFELMNKSAEEGLKIPDEEMKMWKGAFQRWLEYQQFSGVNPNSEFALATGTIALSIYIRTRGIKEQMEDYMRQALEACNPGLIVKKPKVPPQEQPKTEEDERRAA